MESLLESRGHVAVSSSRILQDFEVDPEERQIDDEREDDQGPSSGEEMLPELVLVVKDIRITQQHVFPNRTDHAQALLVIEKIPQIDYNCCSNSHERE